MNRMEFITFITVILLAGATSGSVHAQENKTIPVFDTGVNPNSWVTVAKGDFFAGQHNKKTKVDYDYEIMVTPVTNAQYAEYLNSASSRHTIATKDNKVFGFYPGDKFNKHNHEFEIKAGDKVQIKLDAQGLAIETRDGKFIAKSGWENHPVVQITWFGAKAYCDSNGGRLPSEVEWEKAARGTDTRSYPWGNEVTSAYANLYASKDPFEKSFGKQGTTTPVGFYNGRSYNGFQTKDARSPYGLYDMAGNVWQWSGDVYPNTHYRWLRGGSKNNYDFELRVYNRNSAGPDYHDIDIGFRCVRNK
ncbi:MAG: formylglycine-generating enzyme family protein [Desulfuromonadaceae bacterium]|nr:formylglycine-generating enzyme family protein [Desulfuromonadaceae bacterium]MDD2848638.1 formylglycine-generating enzyme family protein [Desulfuromonadaceae bacterium]MDD4130859.1 formylglycine-generating enzyme family protein [Desulfuromonadaceae bacterium]